MTRRDLTPARRAPEIHALGAPPAPTRLPGALDLSGASRRVRKGARSLPPWRQPAPRETGGGEDAGRLVGTSGRGVRRRRGAFRGPVGKAGGAARSVARVGEPAPVVTGSPGP